MGLDQIILSPFLVKKLYEKSLVNDSVEQKQIISITEKLSTPKKCSIAHLGNNKKNILIIISEEKHAFLPDDQLTFLMNILSACSINMDDVAVVNCFNNTEVSYDNLVQEFSPEVLVFLGTEPQQLGFPLQIPLYKIQKYNKQQYLCAPSLQNLITDKIEKKQLWNVLRTLFSID